MRRRVRSARTMSTVSPQHWRRTAVGPRTHCSEKEDEPSDNAVMIDALKLRTEALANHRVAKHRLTKQTAGRHRYEELNPRG